MTAAMRHLIRMLALVELGEATHEQLWEALTAVDAEPVSPPVNIAMGYWPAATSPNPVKVRADTDTEIEETCR